MTRRWIASLAFASVVALLPGCGDDKAGTSGTGGGTAPPPAANGGAKPANGPPISFGYAANLGEELDRKVGAAMSKARKFLVEKRDAATGGWGEKSKGGVGYTAMAVSAVIGATSREAVGNDPHILKSLEFLASAQAPDGSIVGMPQVTTYETSAALSAFATAKLARFASVQSKARDFLASSQIVGDENSPEYGGFPYKAGQPPDLSNLQFGLGALNEAELPADSPVWARSQRYLARVHNRSETNTAPATGKVGDETVEVVSGNDGGGVYMPGDSKAGLVKRADGKYEAKSYGSMTYALLKCLLFSGVSADDARVKAAVGWISKHFTLDRNPGFESSPDAAAAGQQGYYYYLFTMSRALATYEKSTGKPLVVRDESGAAHDWRKEMATALVALQRTDEKLSGAWLNDKAERWDEGNPILATSYALQALAVCQGRLP